MNAPPPLTLGKIFHLVHITDDLPALESWYDDVFSVRRGWLDHHYAESEQRDASLVTLADVVIEPLAPAFRIDGWDRYPLGRFYNRFGSHWHSIAWYCDDAEPYWRLMRENGIRVFGPAGGQSDEPPAPDSPVFTHPKDTITQIQFDPPRESRRRDPRLHPEYNPHWWLTEHPLGLYGLSYTTVLTRDLARGEHIFADVLGGDVLERSVSELTGTDDIYIRLGEAVVQLSKPTSDHGIAADDLASSGEVHHAACFRVDDLDRAEEYLASKGIKTLARDDQTILSLPETTHGAAFRWTTRVILGGTFEA
jgi:catechol 2,3-dioxygenase-like lactoylglutathione lyase family enzyme